MVILTWLLTILYFSLILTFIRTWIKLSEETIDLTGIKSQIRFSIIIPVRNEEENIRALLEDISKQEYAQDRYEVIVVDDHSTDGTVEKVKSFIHDFPNFFLIELDLKSPVISYKKKAIESGIHLSKGDVIITTDGDCRVKERWLQSINELIVKTGAVCVCGPVTYIKEDRFFTKLQTIEFAALLGSGAATITQKLPGMCNGANLAYKKEAFDSVEGFKGIDNINSGDDELLMHKLLKRYPDDVLFLKNQEGIVYTKANRDLNELYNQRKRWAGKWSYYKSNEVKVLAIFIFVFNAYIALGGIFVLTGLLNVKIFLFHFLLKALIEATFIILVLKFLKKKIHLFHLLLLQIVYPFYTIFFGIVANFGGYVWKDRKVNGKQDD
ncbi:MAG TPA: glycosyltransferase [Cytophagales bacterium]|nr:glycosyltransferase [Cytophagales bacterium]